jgi:Uma2 family endonuclease
MVSQLSPSEVIYPDSDGQPMADNTKQFRWIVVIQQNLDWLFADHSNIFVAGDLLWYPVEGNNKLRTAPDVMVVFGRPKGDRGSYQQWREENIAPQVVFEILSPGNTLTEMNKKQEFYDRYGVEEYYLYDPDKNDLSGWHRVEHRLSVIDPIHNWSSPRLGIQFELTDDTLRIVRPDGAPFASYAEVAQQVAQIEQQLAEERDRAEQERQRAEQERQRAEQERQRAERLAEQLRSMGVDPDIL